VTVSELSQPGGAEPGDEIRVVLLEGNSPQELELTFQGVEEEAIVGLNVGGKPQRVPLDQVQSVEKRLPLTPLQVLGALPFIILFLPLLLIGNLMGAG
jgi:hypothetical protein